MDDIIKEMEKQKTGEKYHDFCIDDAIFHILKAKEIIEGCLENPRDWYDLQSQSAQDLVRFVQFEASFSSLCGQSESL